MISGRESNQGSQPLALASGLKPLSCVACRQRKVKCNKLHPCNHCTKSSIQCVFPNRVRVARAKKASSTTLDMELLKRISRLESLVGKIDATNTSDTMDAVNCSLKETQLAPRRTTDDISPASETGDVSTSGAQSRLDEKYATFVKQQEKGQPYLSSEFWTSLCDEVDGLRQLLENSPDDDDLDDSTSKSPETKYSSPHFILNDPSGSFDSLPPYPSDADRVILFQFYFSNVNPLCKILHKPAISHLLGVKDPVDESTGRFKSRSTEAINFAIYFAAVTSMSPEECLSYFNEEKNELVARYKSGTELALTHANFMNSMEIVTLQALTLYMMALRSHDKSRSSWTLIGLAVRIAHGLGIHRDGPGLAHTAFEAQMRRRLWWELIVLDIKSSEDRGSEPMIAEYSFNTRMPCNLNDDDFGVDSQHPISDRKGVTDMTFSVISMDVSYTVRKLNFVSADAEHRPLSLRKKEELVKECSERIENHYLAGCDLANPHHWLLYMLGRLLILKLWSAIQYPLQNRQPQDLPSGQSLRTVVSYLEINEMMEVHKSATGFTWYFSTYVPWHALAVALAELCHETQGPLADRAWAVVENCYDKYSERVADTKEGMLWRPIRSLLKRAEAARQRARQPDAFQPDFQHLENATTQESKTTPHVMNSSLELTQNVYDTSAVGASMIQLNQTPYSLFEDNFSSLTNMPLPTNQTPNDEMTWNDWNDFVLDVHTLSPLVMPNVLMDPSMPD